MKLVKPVHETLEQANVRSAVFCTVKYVNRYLLLCGPDGTVTAWSTLKAAETSWKRNYTRLAKQYMTVALQRHFDFFQPVFHVVTDVDRFEKEVCPEPRETIDAEYVCGNCLGITCDVEAAKALREKSGHKIKIDFKVVDRIAKIPRV